MTTILAAYVVNERLACSGQPQPEQFVEMAAAGYQVVLNLALTTSSNAIVAEDEHVLAAGMQYCHIPIRWAEPQLADALLCFAVLDSLRSKRVWVHCALNKRASCLLYLYQRYHLSMSEAVARPVMEAIWQPEGAWLALMADVEQYYSSLKW